MVKLNSRLLNFWVALLEQLLTEVHMEVLISERVYIISERGRVIEKPHLNISSFC